MNIGQLLTVSQEFEAVAGKIQVGERVGLADDEIKTFVEKYQDWYSDCLSVLPDGFHSRFRSEYEGMWIVAKIKKFLEAPTKVSVIPRNDEKSAAVFPYWQHPFETCFRGPLLAQRQILLEASKKKPVLNVDIDAIGRIELLARRFHLVALQLLQRRKNRQTLRVQDEYDVQDLFHSLLQIFFGDIRPEETTPSYAGGHTRIDYLLKSEQVVVEIKKTRPNLKAKDVRDQLIVDIECYRIHPDCKALVAFVYDPDRHIDNPKALENDLSRVADTMIVKVIVVQH